MQASGATAQDPAWKEKELGEETRYVREKEQAQLQAIRTEQAQKEAANAQEKHPMDREFEGGFGGQEDLEDRYATTSGEH
ncbi:hypothetical protein CPC08DRAFT_543813 [Agrocybe pediades]|nr:hypothetical protein CPC08DRAFT_543813 [Agrocybe pediades]